MPKGPTPLGTIKPIPMSITEKSRRISNALHFALKHEQRVWGSGGDHEKAHAKVVQLEAEFADFTLDILRDVEGNITIKNGVATLPDGAQIAL